MFQQIKWKTNDIVLIEGSNENRVYLLKMPIHAWSVIL